MSNPPVEELARRMDQEIMGRLPIMTSFEVGVRIRTVSAAQELADLLEVERMSEAELIAAIT